MKSLIRRMTYWAWHKRIHGIISRAYEQRVIDSSIETVCTSITQARKMIQQTKDI